MLTMCACLAWSLKWVLSQLNTETCGRTREGGCVNSLSVLPQLGERVCGWKELFALLLLLRGRREKEGQRFILQLSVKMAALVLPISKLSEAAGKLLWYLEINV